MGENISNLGTLNFSESRPFKLVYYSPHGSETQTLSGGISLCQDLPLKVSARTLTQLFDKARCEAFIREAMDSDALIVTLHGGPDSFAAWAELEEALKQSEGKKIPYIHIHPTASDLEGVEWAKKYSTEFDSDNYATGRRYLTTGGRENYAQFLRHILNAAGGLTLPLEPPLIQPQDGIYHPDLPGLPSLAEYFAQKIDPKKPTVGIWFSQFNYLNGNLKHLDGLIRAVENKGANALPVFHLRYPDSDLKNKGALWVAQNFFMDDHDKPLIDVLLSVMSFSMVLTCPETHNLFTQLGIPIIQATVCYSPREVWAESYQGLPTMDVSISAAQPEFDGNLIAVPFAFKEQSQIDPLTHSLIVTYEADQERADKLASLAVNWGKLRRTPPAERRIAIVFHHYPPRNDRIGCAAGLDSFRSVVNILKDLKSQGYQVDRTFEGPDELAHEILGRMTCDRRWLTPEQMSAQAEARAGAEWWQGWHDELPEETRKKMLADWGELPGDLFTYKGEMLFPGLPTGNVFISVQPPRGLLEKIESVYHDFYVTPPHHYLAQYRWFRDVWKAQAIVHVGKHGSLEWLPGKALGLSQTCYPDLAIMDLPNIYPYIINDPGEGTQAKRRSYCCIIDHLTPAFTNADLYDDLASVDALVAELRLAEKEDPSKIPVLQNLIIEKAITANLDRDLSLSLAEIEGDFAGFLEKLHTYLDELYDTMIGDGLHTLGEVPEGKMLTEFLVQLTRIEGPGAPSLRESLLRARGFDYDALLASRGKTDLSYGGKSGAEILRENHHLSLKLVEALSEENFSPLAVPEIITSILGQEDPLLEQTLRYIATRLVPDIQASTAELSSTLAALAGEFVSPGPSGAPTRGQCDILPTGRNFYSVDPNKIPSPAAWKMGMAMGDVLLERTLKETGKYPENVGIIVYGTSTMRTRGDDVAEIYYLMGLRPIWREGGTVAGLSVIPLAELGRPRIDVTPRISGFFRDSFPNIVETLDRAVDMVAKLNEPLESNFLRSHVYGDLEFYRGEGLSEEEAWREATFRVFGCPPGTYGAGVQELVEAKKWNTMADLGEIYIRYSGHAYGQNSYGLTRPKNFRRNLSRMDVTVKNEDSREYDMMSCTDYYNYYGGLIAASHTVRGIAPLSLMGDGSDPKRLKIRTTAEEAKHILRARLVNPKWLEGIKRHGYKGAGDISHMMDVMFGWDATAEVMEDWMYQKAAETYALDPKMKEWMEKVNPYARQNILDKLLEAISRGMWNADDAIHQKLQSEYLELEGRLEEWNDREEESQESSQIQKRA
ncbi:MAG: cobaltochelatase subunit CobN [Deltaproteobacteria bacterium]|jgi:cobaltochelatase CobN|nr:cobaltochelatase subunit CobN [Deltaproteobacteria bacterium]